MRNLFTLLLLSACLLPTVGEARVIRDYIFAVTGVVRDESGAPLEDANVTIRTADAVYKATTPVKMVCQLTNSTGGFVFMYTSHKRAVKYNITVVKDGYEPQTISGSAPPAGHHSVRRRQQSANWGNEKMSKFLGALGGLGGEY